MLRDALQIEDKAFIDEVQKWTIGKDSVASYVFLIFYVCFVLCVYFFLL